MRRHFKSRNYIWNSQECFFQIWLYCKKGKWEKAREKYTLEGKKGMSYGLMFQFVYLKICPRLMSTVPLSTKKGFEAFTLMKSEAFNAKLLKGTTWNMTTSLGLCYCISNSVIVNSYKLEKCDVPHLWSSGLCSYIFSSVSSWKHPGGLSHCCDRWDCCMGLIWL